MDKPLENSKVRIPDNVFLVIDKQLLPITQETITIGRHPSNNLIITDPRVSRWHAQLRFEEGEFVIYDMDAKFGVSVNNEQVKRGVLRSGDTISLANTPLLFIDRSDNMIRKIHDTTGMLSNSE
jgi:pSer/pThr/pTyr-binding forkhead associated (FHA) protein